MPSLYSICTALRTQHLNQHGNSRRHAAACSRFMAKLRGVPCNSVALPGLIGAPVANEFGELVKHLASPESSQNIGNNHKRRALAWCLVEAKMDMERKLLRHARSICFAQDERMGDLLVHISACTTTLQRIRCFMGFTKCLGTDAYDIMRTTEAIIDRYCTPRADPPKYSIRKIKKQSTSAELSSLHLQPQTHPRPHQRRSILED